MNPIHIDINPETLLTLVLAIFASSGFWAFISLILQNKYSKENTVSEHQRAQDRMLVGLGHDRIVTLCSQYLDRGYITQDEYDDVITYLYLPYKDLGGNGTAEMMVEKIKNLPIK